MIRNYEEFCVSQFATKKVWLAGPDWWSAEGTSIWKTTPVDSENHAPVTVGQLKHVAAMARLHLQGTLASVGGEGAAIAAMVDAFTTADPENAAPANVGQLKNVAALFYDRLAQVGYAWQTGTFSTTTATTPYPWTGTVHPENAMPCNIGQLKNIFSFAVTTAFLEEDGDGDGIPSWWERAWQFDPLMSNSDFDADLDQLSNLEEYLLTVYTGFSYNPRMASTAGTTWTDYEQSLMTGGLTEQETAVLRGSDPHVLRAHPLYGSIQKGVEFWRAQQLISSAPEMPPFVANVGNSKQWLVNNGNESSFNDVPNAPVGVFEDIAAYLPEWPEDLLSSGAVPFHPGLSEMVIHAGGGTNRIADEETYTYRNLAGYMAVGQIWLKLPQRVSFPVKRTIHILKKTRYFQNAVEPVQLPSSPEDELITHVFHLPASVPPMPEAVVPFPEVPPAGPILLGAPAGAGSSVVPEGPVITDGKEIIPFHYAVSQDGVGHVSTATRFRFVFSAWPPETFGKVGGTPVTTETESTVYLPVRLNENKEQDTAAASQNLPGAPAPANALPDIDRNRATVSATEFLPVETREFDRDFIVLDMDTASLPQEEVKLELIVSESSSTKVYLYDEEGRAIPPADCLSTDAHPIAPIWEKLATGQIRAEIGRLNTAAAEVPGSPPLPAPGPATLTVRATFLNPYVQTGPGGPPPNIVLEKSIVLLPVELQSVTFSGSGTSEFFTVKADDGTDFSAPHWKDTGGDGNLVKTDGDHTFPVAYVRNKIPQVAATIKLSPGLAGLRIKASHTDGFTMTTAPLTVPASGIVEIPATSLTQPLPNTVFHYPAFKLTWEISINGGAWSRIGESKNPLYVLRRAPLLGVDQLPGAVALTEMRYTLVHTSCALANGETADDSIISAVNTHFIIWNAKRLRYDAQKGSALGAPEPIYYYKNWETTDRTNDILRINTLLARPQSGTLPSCQCYVFAEMLRDMLKIQGIPATAPVIVYDWDGDIPLRRFLVKHWTFSGTGTSGVVGWPYKQDAPNEYEYIGGTLGQNNEHCPGVFDNHCLVRLADGRFYDPSYGSGPYQSLTAHDWTAFSGYERIQNGLLDPPSAARKNTEAFGDTRAFDNR